MHWPFDEITTEHMGVALTMLISAVALWIKVHSAQNGGKPPEPPKQG